jgi:hypothetical protein
METLNPAFVGGPENGTTTQWMLWTKSINWPVKYTVHV